MIQSIIFQKNKWTPQRAIKWLLRHEYKASKIDETNDYYRFRQFTPNPKDQYYTKDIGKGIKFIIEIPSGIISFK